MPRKCSIGSKFSKMSYFNDNFRKFENFGKEKEFIYFLMRSCSTSYPSGNQVDGSPLVAMPIRGELA